MSTNERVLAALKQLHHAVRYGNACRYVDKATRLEAEAAIAEAETAPAAVAGGKDAGQQAAESAAVAACREVLAWAKAPGNHGGNPWAMEFVKLAEKAVADADGVQS